MHKFIENIIGFSLKNHVFILFMTGVLFVAGIACYQNTPIEAYPDVTLSPGIMTLPILPKELRRVKRSL